MSDAAAGALPADVPPEVFLAMGRDILAKQGLSRLLGTELVGLKPGHCELALPLDDRLTQHNGFAHGGTLSYLADLALTYAGGTAMKVPVITSEMKINYVRPGIGERLIARAEAIAVSRTQAVCRCDVFAVKGGVEKLVAMAQGTIAKLSDAGDGRG